MMRPSGSSRIGTRRLFFFDVGGELTEGLAGEQRKQVRHGMKLVHHGCLRLLSSTSIIREGVSAGRGVGACGNGKCLRTKALAEGEIP